MIYIYILAILIFWPFLLPRKYRIWIWLLEFFFVFHFLSKKLKWKNWFTNFLGNKASKQLAKIKEDYIEKKDIAFTSRSDDIAYIERALKDID